MILLINPCINQFVVITIWLPRFRHMTCSKHVKSTNMQHCSPDKNQSGDWTIQNSSPPTSSKEIKAKLHLQIFDTIFLPRPLLQKYVGQHLSTNDVIITIGFIARNSSNEQKRNHPSPRSLRPSSSTANCSASGGRGCGNRASPLGLRVTSMKCTCLKTRTVDPKRFTQNEQLLSRWVVLFAKSWSLSRGSRKSSLYAASMQETGENGQKASPLAAASPSPPPP